MFSGGGDRGRDGFGVMVIGSGWRRVDECEVGVFLGSGPVVSCSSGGEIWQLLAEAVCTKYETSLGTFVVTSKL